MLLRHSLVQGASMSALARQLGISEHADGGAGSP
jgi:hypothetical protein